MLQLHNRCHERRNHCHGLEEAWCFIKGVKYRMHSSAVTRWSSDCITAKILWTKCLCTFYCTCFVNINRVGTASKYQVHTNEPYYDNRAYYYTSLAFVLKLTRLLKTQASSWQQCKCDLSMLVLQCLFSYFRCAWWSRMALRKLLIFHLWFTDSSPHWTAE